MTNNDYDDNYLKCDECDFIAERQDFDSKDHRGSRDSEGFQYEPDETVYYCPKCHSDNTEAALCTEVEQYLQEQIK